jgi:GT2 family glycosyltransferase
MQNIEINIIIPCYYPSEIIEPCFQSLSNQTAKNKIKIFMVNDCSPHTNCDYLDIREKYNDLNIQYLKTKENSGPGISR